MLVPPKTALFIWAVVIGVALAFVFVTSFGDRLMANELARCASLATKELAELCTTGVHSNPMRFYGEAIIGLILFCMAIFGFFFFFSLPRKSSAK